jgi:2',3'-cyclic-nucleotide 2'-phosphodiesterase (5'-nucleotidase family)
MRFTLVLLLVFHILGCKNIYTIHTSLSNIPISNESRADNKIDSITSIYRDKMSSQLQATIGFAPEALEKGKPEGKLGNLLADFTYQFAKKTFPQHPIYASLLNNGGIRTSIPQGKITVNDIYELMPFDNRLILVELNPSQWNRLLHYLEEKEGQPIAGFQLNLSNLSFHSSQIQEFPLWIATSDYLAQGGDGMTFLNENNKKIETPHLLRDIFINEIQVLTTTGKEITAKIEGRIIK